MVKDFCGLLWSKTFVDHSLIQFSETDLLGEGSYGRVFLGSFHGMSAAVKKILLGSTMNDKDIMHEINVSLRLSHPNIVRLMAVAQKEEYFLLATEYIHGATLDDILHEECCLLKLESGDASGIALDLSMAVEYIHSQKVIHQDLKPANIMVHHPTKRAVLTDWGLANIKDTVMLPKSHAAGPVGGTYLYMAPECFISFQEASCYSDIWSLGATYVELFTGSLPWHVKKQRELATLMSANTPPHGLSLLSDSYSFVAELMNYDPLMRPSASKIVQKLKSLVDLKARYGFKW